MLFYDSAVVLCIETVFVFYCTRFSSILNICFFFIELYIGVHQFFLNINSADGLALAIQGSLMNSGVYSYFLVINLPFLLYALKGLKCSSKIRQAIFSAAIILVSAILLVTHSRTAILTFIAGGSACLWCKYQNGFKKYFQGNKNKVFIAVIAGLVLSVFYFFLIEFKQNSLYGRLFIWIVSCKHIYEHLYIGIGVGQFSNYYPLWQIEYFSSHNITQGLNFLNADETHIAFNEPLQILLETGIIGLACFIGVLIYLFRIRSFDNKVYTNAAKSTLLLIMISAATSYPLHCNAMMFLFAFCAASLLKNKANIKVRQILKPVFLKWIVFIGIQCLLLVAINKVVKQCILIARWNAVREDVFMKPSRVRAEYYKIYPELVTNGKFLLDMGEHLSDIGDTGNAIKIFERSKKYYISSRTFFSTANAYYISNNVPGAIINLQALANMIPSQFLPKYELAKLYYQSKDSIKGDAIARQILIMQVKKPSASISRIKGEMTNILKNEVKNK